jgi:hypothetical protein
MAKASAKISPTHISSWMECTRLGQDNIPPTANSQPSKNPTAALGTQVSGNEHHSSRERAFSRGNAF